MKLLSTEAIINLQRGKKTQKYKFQVLNRSISENFFLSHFWTYLVYNFFPVWLAPNLITFCGAICGLVGGILFYFFFPEPWVLITTAILFLIYQTLDGCDGKQARKTETGSQLGEILDHGVDAIILSVFTYVLAQICFWEPNPYLYSWLWITFFTAHWEHFHTNVFYMGYLNACDAQNLIIALLVGVFSFELDILREKDFIFSKFEYQYLIKWIIFLNCN